jgi:hypothetical protein
VIGSGIFEDPWQMDGMISGKDVVRRLSTFILSSISWIGMAVYYLH